MHHDPKTIASYTIALRNSVLDFVCSLAFMYGCLNPPKHIHRFSFFWASSSDMFLILQDGRDDSSALIATLKIKH